MRPWNTRRELYQHVGNFVGSVISPILSNIYLHELDRYVFKLINEFDKGKTRKQNQAYHILSGKIQTLYRKVDLLKSEGRRSEAEEVLEDIKRLREQRSKLPASDPCDEGYRRLRYCRYADDILFGVIGTKKEAEILKERVENFLSSTLKLSTSIDKSTVAHASDGTEYLGYGVRCFDHTRITIGERNGRIVPRKAGRGRVQLFIPKRKIEKFTQEHRYGNYGSKSTQHRSNLLYRDDVEIAMTYNSEIRGFANYYQLVGDVKTELRTLYYIWESSLLKTLAYKHKSTTRKMRKLLKSGNRLVVKYSVQGKSKELWLFKLMDIKVGKVSYNVDRVPSTLRFHRPRTTILKRLNASECEYCQKQQGYFEVHHVKKLKDLKGKAPWERRMIVLRRKTLILCVDCHQELHKGSLPDYRHLIKR